MKTNKKVTDGRASAGGFPARPSNLCRDFGPGGEKKGVGGGVVVCLKQKNQTISQSKTNKIRRAAGHELKRVRANVAHNHTREMRNRKRPETLGHSVAGEANFFGKKKFLSCFHNCNKEPRAFAAAVPGALAAPSRALPLRPRLQ
jgi:hypothetical protein